MSRDRKCWNWVHKTIGVNQVYQNTSLPLTTTMVNLKIPKSSNKNPTHPPGLWDSSKHVGESPNPLNFISRTSFRAGKQVHSRGRPQTHCIIRHSSRSVSASSASRNPSLEALSSSSSGESEEESVGSDPKTSTAPMSYASLLVWKWYSYSDINSKLYKPIFHGSHLSHNTSYGSAATIWVFYLLWQRYSYSTQSSMMELLLSVSQYWNLHLGW